ncbi:hypothetical protein K402DRAFT_449100 [Aulographum hederae CBS 113979]|uniref:Uncharacterized protein n=1 Tax=Aulographum hederae CBS 113979 TaxID=1176131 RepID=A0A6G1GL59_9PEZI|nr:hypothetical protein K402DRAFT_449100 [Aulographum hederae CBS 113979]
MDSAPVPIIPNRGIGWITLGVSVHDILTRLKANPQLYPTIDVSYSASQPIAAPIIINLPRNGLRLRFDGPDQRLRLIEVLDFTKTKLSYNDSEIVKVQDNSGELYGPGSACGPSYRGVYKLWGPANAPEYIPPAVWSEEAKGIYVLSYPGIAFMFPLQASAWSEHKDWASLISSSAASPASSLAVFHGESWPEARTDLFTNEPPNPRSLALTSRAKDGRPDEIETAKIHGEGRIELVRRTSPPLWIILSETTPQDLVTELGPPDAIYRKNDRRLSIYNNRGNGRSNGVSPSPSRLGDYTDTESSSHTETDESQSDDEDSGPGHDDRETRSAECFYNYFHHGFDVFISQPKAISPPSPTMQRQDPMDEANPSQEVQATNHLTATKIIFHANIPGSYPFNRHRRSRWTLEHVPSEQYKDPLNSEMRFRDIQGRLKEVFKTTYANEDEERSQQRPMVLNRGWGDSPGSSCELLGGWEESVGGKKKDSEDVATMGEQSLGNTELYGFPGMVFEVLKNDAVSCLTVF